MSPDTIVPLPPSHGQILATMAERSASDPGVIAAFELTEAEPPRAVKYQPWQIPTANEQRSFAMISLRDLGPKRDALDREIQEKLQRLAAIDAECLLHRRTIDQVDAICHRETPSHLLPQSEAPADPEPTQNTRLFRRAG